MPTPKQAQGPCEACGGEVTGRTRRAKYCLGCAPLAAKGNWRAKNPAYSRAYHRKARYGVTTQQFEDMMVAQECSCAICRVTLDRPCIDHDHDTGAVRGLLCQNCNAGIGLLKEDPAIFTAAMRYLGHE